MKIVKNKIYLFKLDMVVMSIEQKKKKNPKNRLNLIKPFISKMHKN